ncbi:protease m1 zinc metalloprotease [Anopheles darlingi]|uniref:Aminopeptidase n=1 Tax=Anopheles darlingi TaxID=43151 RepID=W5JNE9_ANODA|nr:protease m1 zinc metalloprotease [Anopheles darlingi]
MLLAAVLPLLILSLISSSSATPDHHPLRGRWRELRKPSLVDQPAKRVSPPEEQRYRLPTYIVPTHYNLYIESQVHTGNRSFSGQVDINIDIRQPTRTIYVHNRGLTITWNELVKTIDGDSYNETLLYTVDTEREFIIFATRDTLLPGNEHVLRIAFQGELRTDADGFYLSSYLNTTTGTRKYLAATQFQAISARSAFPCFDEPAMKASFSVVIKHHPSYKATSNMPSYVSAGDEDGYVVDYFETTPRMSVYLLAFMVSDFPYIEEGQQRVYARPTSINQTQYALEAGLRILAALDEYTGIPYSDYMPKIDQVALPDFDAGAMENWGLCNYREEYLLYQPGVSTYLTETFITTIIAHEYAHQWFGNVVTNEWWSYLWLNEGFATLYEYMAADLAYPERRYRDLFNVDIVQPVLRSDSSENTRPMTFSRGATFDAIISIFDNVAYSKAGSVLRMFRQVIGIDTWRQIVREHIERSEFGSVNPAALITAMETVTGNASFLPDGIDMEAFVSSWADQAGYPVLEVRRTYAGELILSQDRFYNNKIVNDDTSVWMIPYTLLEQNAPWSVDSLADWQWLTVRAVRIPSAIPDDHWLLANVNQTGYYRVNYDARNWQMLIGALLDDHTTIPMASRSQLVDDAFQLARANRLDMEVALELLSYVRDEREYPPWESVNTALSYLAQRLRGTPDYGLYQLWVDTLIGDVFVGLDVTGVPPSGDASLLDKFLQQLISSWACRMEIESCLADTREALERELTGVEPVHPDVSSVVYCYGLRSAPGSDAFQYLYGKLQASANRAERSLLIDALGCANDPDELDALLLTAIGGELQVNYTPEERYYVLTSVLVSRDGVDALVRFLTDNHPYVETNLGPGILYSLVQSIATRTNTPDEEQMLNELLERLEPALPATVAANVRTTVSRNLAWSSSREGVLVSYFLQRYRPIPV